LHDTMEEKDWETFKKAAFKLKGPAG
jgi:hypothetical protein